MPRFFVRQDQIADGVVLHDSQGKGMALRARVRDYIAAQPGKSAGENEESLAWCRKMLTRSARADAEGVSVNEVVHTALEEVMYK